MRFRPSAVAAAVLTLVAAVPADAARYRYARGRATNEGGLFVFVEGALTNPRNTDTVIAVEEVVQDVPGGVDSLTTIRPSWSEDPAGRLGIGYRWPGGSVLTATVWGYQTEARAIQDGTAGGTLHFTVGPPIFHGGSYVGNSGAPGFADILTEIQAQTGDISWGGRHGFTDAFTMEWSVGLQVATYEETQSGSYDEVDFNNLAFGQNSFAADKHHKAEMAGGRVAARGSYRFGRFDLDGGVALSLLDGKIDATSSLVPTGTTNATTTPASFASIEDDGRSGSIRTVDFALGYHFCGERCEVYVGWEESTWEEIAADLLRNLPGTSAPLASRDAVSFSGYKLGFRWLF